MNNRFKFRVWTGHKMEHSVGVCPAGAFYYAGINPKDTACIETTLYDEKTHLWVKTMQFTGLTDKNNNEIYEGDILVTQKKHYEKEYYIVEYINDGFKKVRTTDRYSDNLLNSLDWLELIVIGNIYENSELLK